MESKSWQTDQPACYLTFAPNVFQGPGAFHASINKFRLIVSLLGLRLRCLGRGEGRSGVLITNDFDFWSCFESWSAVLAFLVASGDESETAPRARGTRNTVSKSYLARW